MKAVKLVDDCVIAFTTFMLRTIYHIFNDDNNNIANTAQEIYVII